MTPFKFVHMADVHLDTSFLSRDPYIRSRLKEAIRASFKKAIDLCINRKVHCLLIAGDLFDGERLSFETEGLILREFDRLRQAGIQVCYCTGNHDPGLSRSRAGTLEFPSNVHAFREGRPVTVSIKDEEGYEVGTVTACGHRHQKEYENLAALFPQAQGGIPQVAMLHTMVSEAAAADGHEPYAPCSIQDLTDKGYDYWALGHVHIRQKVCEGFDIYYPGNIQGRNPRETGAKGCLYAEVFSGSRARVEFCDLSTIRWFSFLLQDLHKYSTFAQLKAGILERCSQNSGGEHGEDCLYRIELAGRSPLYRDFTDDSIKAMEEELTAETGALRIELSTDRLRPFVIEETEVGPSFYSNVKELLQKLCDDDELLDTIIPDKLAGSVSSSKEERRRYARSLLDGLDEEFLSRWVKEQREKL